MNDINYAFSKIKDVEPSSYIDAYYLILECSDARTPKEFAITFIRLAERICHYDQAIAFFHDLNGKIAGVYSIGTDEGWLESYLNYYIELYPEFDVTTTAKPKIQYFVNSIIDFDSFPDSEFKRDYFDAVNLKYTWPIIFYGMNDEQRITICLDRRRKQAYTKEERETIMLAYPILNNMVRNFFFTDSQDADSETVWKEYGLTKREIEVADFLCKGMKSSRISSTLFIAEGTTRKHIANIYSKVGVKSQQELIARMLSR